MSVMYCPLVNFYYALTNSIKAIAKSQPLNIVAPDLFPVPSCGAYSTAPASSLMCDTRFYVLHSLSHVYLFYDVALLDRLLDLAVNTVSCISRKIPH